MLIFGSQGPYFPSVSLQYMSIMIGKSRDETYLEGGSPWHLTVLNYIAKANRSCKLTHNWEASPCTMIPSHHSRFSKVGPQRPFLLRFLILVFINLSPHAAPERNGNRCAEALGKTHLEPAKMGIQP